MDCILRTLEFFSWNICSAASVFRSANPGLPSIVAYLTAVLYATASMQSMMGTYVEAKSKVELKNCGRAHQYLRRRSLVSVDPTIQIASFRHSHCAKTLV